MDRRDFLRGVAGLAAVPAMGGVAGLRPPGTSRRLTRIGIQLYTLRELAARDLEATLAAAAGAGYTEIELLGFTRNYGHEPASWSRSGTRGTRWWTCAGASSTCRSWNSDANGAPA
jgi:hypothetical protein